MIITRTPPSTIGEIVTQYCTVKPEKRKGYINSDLKVVMALLRYTVLKHINQQNTIVKSIPQCSSYESMAHYNNKCSSKIHPPKLFTLIKSSTV